MFRAFGHPVVTCCEVLRHVGCCWLKFETGQLFHLTFLDVAWCCSRLARFVQQCCTRAWALVRFSIPNMSHHVATCRNKVAKRVQHDAALKCCDRLPLGQQCYDMLWWYVAKIYHFPYPIYDLSKISIHFLRPEPLCTSDYDSDSDFFSLPRARVQVEVAVNKFYCWFPLIVQTRSHRESSLCSVTSRINFCLASTVFI